MAGIPGRNAIILRGRRWPCRLNSAAGNESPALWDIFRPAWFRHLQRLAIAIFTLCFSFPAGAQITPINSTTRIAFGDANGDGLLDAAAGNNTTLYYFANTGTAHSPVWGNAVNLSLTGSNNFAPALADLDLDGDLDLFSGHLGGGIIYYENRQPPGSQAPVWVLVNNASQSYGGIRVPAYDTQSIGFVDLDGDGDLDLTVNTYASSMLTFFNQDREADGWVDGKGIGWIRQDNIPLTVINLYNPKHHWADPDADGDFDLVAGSGNAYSLLTRYYVNNGGASDYTHFSSVAFPWENQLQYQNISPFFDDFNADGFLDLYYTAHDPVTRIGYLLSIPSINRSGQSVDDQDPSFPAQDFHLNKPAGSNAITLDWPVVTDSSASTYRSGIYSYELHRSNVTADFTPEAGTLIWRHHHIPHRGGYLPGLAEGDRFKISGGRYYFQDRWNAGGANYYYKLIVRDFAGRSFTAGPLGTYVDPSYPGTLNLGLAPSFSSGSLDLQVSIKDQYGMPFPVSPKPGTVDANVVFTVLNAGGTAPTGIPLFDTVQQTDLPDDIFDLEDHREYDVTYRPDNPCSVFRLRVTVTHWLNASDSVSLSAATPAEISIDREPPPLPVFDPVPPEDITDTSIVVRWEPQLDACTGLVSLKIYHAAATGGFTLLKELGPSSNSYTHTSLLPFSVHRYYVTSVDQAGNETSVPVPAAVAISARTTDSTPPSAPEFTAAAYLTPGYDGVFLRWSAAADSQSGIEKYYIEKKDGPSGAFQAAATVYAPDLSWTDPAAFPGHAVYYQIRAVNWQGLNSAWSSIVTVDVMDSAPPSIPAWISVTPVSKYRIDLSWNPSTDGETFVKGYRIYRSFTLSGTYTLIADTAQTSFSHQSLSPGVKYFYKLRAYDIKTNLSDYSTTRSATTFTNTPPLAQNGSMTLSEDASADGTLIASDGDGDSLTYRIGTQGSKGTATILDETAGTYRYQAAADAFGSDTFSFIANDGRADSQAASVTVTILPVNDPPGISAAGDLACQDNLPGGPAPFTITDDGHPGTTIQLTARSSDQNLVPNANILLGMDGGSCSITVTPAENRIGVATVTITVSDGQYSAQTDCRVILSPYSIAVADLSPSPVSGQTIMDAILANGVSAAALGSLSEYPLICFDAVFVCLGADPSTHILEPGEGALLKDYLDAGGRVYLEGGDTWYFDPATVVHPYFHTAGESEKESGLAAIGGMSETPFGGLFFLYDSGLAKTGHLTSLSGASAVLSSQTPPFGTAVSFSGGNFSTFAASFEFGRLVDGSGANNKTYLMQRVLEHFGYTHFNDINLDGTVNSIDLSLLIAYLAGDLSSIPNFTMADYDKNGTIDAGDVAGFLRLLTQ